ncbi:hypothetical protein AALA00_09470 [Lachnospiraceae bacterium 46-15]
MVKNIKQSFRVCAAGVKRSLANPRIYIALFLVFIFMQELIAPIRTLAETSGYNAAPWMFPFFVQSYYCQMILLLGIVLLYCDAPFFCENTFSILIRTGRKNWYWGQVLYIISISILYFGAVLLMPMILLMPYIYLKNEWGTILGTLAQTNASQTLGTMRMDYNLMLAFSPFEALGYSFVMSCMNGILVGLVIYTVNMFAKRVAGITAGAILAFSPFLAINFSDAYWGYYVFPPTWMNILRLDFREYSRYPSFIYGAVFFITAYIILIFVSYKTFEKKAIQTMPTI